MPNTKFTDIYDDLKAKIEGSRYSYQDLLPSENVLIKKYVCSRNTVRRAISLLVGDGYVQPIHGKGVRVIYQKPNQTEYLIGGIETFKESAIRNKKKPSTKVIFFNEEKVDATLSKKTGFKINDEVFHIKRVRYLDDIPLILDDNFFLKNIMPDLTKQIANDSVYDYLEKNLGINIVTSKRWITVKIASNLDKKYLELDKYNCVAMVSSQTYDNDGNLIEYTESRHRPDFFSFQNTASRYNYTK